MVIKCAEVQNQYNVCNFYDQVHTYVYNNVTRKKRIQGNNKL